MPNRYTTEEHKDHPAFPAPKQLVVVEVGPDLLGKRKKAFIFDPMGPGKSTQYEDDFYWLGTIRRLSFLGGIEDEEMINGRDYDDLIAQIKDRFNLI